jgi:hypothetical protein
MLRMAAPCREIEMVLIVVRVRVARLPNGARTGARTVHGQFAAGGSLPRLARRGMISS